MEKENIVRLVKELKNAKDNLLDLVVEIASEFEECE